VYSDDHWAEHDLAAMPTVATPEPVAYGTVVSTWSRASTADILSDAAHVLFVEANTSGTGMLALRTARELGLRPVLATGAPDRYPQLADLNCEQLICDTNSESALRAAIQRRFRREELSGITTTSEFYVPMLARLTAWLGLPGNPVAAVYTCRDKSALRVRLRAAGLPQPRFAVVTDLTQVASAVREVGLPCVVKPVDDSGSNDVLLCSSAAQALDQVTRILAVRFNVRGLPTAGAALIEEYLEGPEYSVEMFSTAEATHCVGVTAKSVTGSPYFVESRHIFPVLDPGEQLSRLVRRALDATGIRLGPTHTDVKLTATGPMIVEINPRLAGGMIPALVRNATGIDLLAQQLRIAVGQPAELTPTVRRHAGIQFLLADTPGLLRGVDGVAEAERVPGAERVTVTAPSGTEVRPPRNAYDRIGHIIATHEDPSQVDRILDRAVGKIRLVVDDHVPEGQAV
jgi:cysteine synthase A